MKSSDKTSVLFANLYIAIVVGSILIFILGFFGFRQYQKSRFLKNFGNHLPKTAKIEKLYYSSDIGGETIYCRFTDSKSNLIKLCEKQKWRTYPLSTGAINSIQIVANFFSLKEKYLPEYESKPFRYFSANGSFDAESYGILKIADAEKETGWMFINH